MKIATFGAKHWGSQLPRIEQGFVALGHEIVETIDSADVIYANNSPYDQILRDKSAGLLRGKKLIFCCLDVPFHIRDFDYITLESQLRQADAVCSISKYVRWQLQATFDLDSTIIYQPIKPVSYDPTLRRNWPYRFLSAGRRSDPNKRSKIWVDALQLLGYSHSQVALVGNEPGWGDWLGVATDQELNMAYNSVDFVLATGLVEGMCLPVLEAMACGAIPVACRDLTTRNEFLPSDLFPEYDEVDPDPVSIAKFIARYVQDEKATREMKERLRGHFVANWQDKLSGISVARRILEVYERIN